MNDCKINVVISTATKRTAAPEGRLNLLMGTGNDVRRHEPISDALTCIGSSSDGRVDSTGFTTNHDRDVTTTHVLTTDQGHFRGFGHGICRFNGGNHSPGFDHPQGNALDRIRNNNRTR